VIAALISGRLWIAVAAAVGLVVAWTLIWLVRLIRRRPLLVFAVLAVALIVGGCAFYMLYYRLDANPSAAPVPEVTVRYHATGQLDNDQVRLREEIVIDDSTMAAINRVVGPSISVLLAPGPEWQQGSSVDGNPSYVRTRTLTPEDNSLLNSTITIPIELGSFSLQGNLIGLVPRDGSRLELTGDKGALAAAYPNAASVVNDPRRNGAEVTTIAVDRDVVDVSLAVLKGPLRNPVGVKLYEASVWGPLPWAIGAFFGLITSVLGDKLLGLLGLVARRAVRGARRPDPPVPAAPGAA
jgi:hypothetical protein